jgi:hypothetical protein
MSHNFAIAQDNAIEKTITTSTNNGDITLKLLLYDADDPDTPLDNIQTYITFKDKDCTALGPGDPNLSPPGNPNLPLPWGEFHYGLWRCRITLEEEFDSNIHSIHNINMEIYFPGQTDPLNAEYQAQQYDNDKKKAVWKKFGQDSFFPNVAEHSIIIRLSDSRPSESGSDDIISGFGDRDPNQGVIDHVGGLLWPIPGKGRCFIDYTWSKSPL